MADHAKPILTDNYTDVLSQIRGRFEDQAKGFDPANTTATNIATGTIRWTSASNKWQKWSGTAWTDLSSLYAINISGNAATATNASTVTNGVYTVGDQTIAGVKTFSSTIQGSISGNAGSASSVAWANVSGRPTNVSSFTNDSGYITSAGRAYPRRSDGADINFFWSGQSGQPSWLWGGNDGANTYVYNPSNFSVAYAASAGSANSVPWTGVSGRPTAVSSFTNDSGYVNASGAAAQVNTTNVLNATSGASTGAVGTYAWCIDIAGSDCAPGATKAGSSLRYNFAASGSLTGTWRAMSWQVATNSGLFLRIS